jgi:hypothetical protein
MLSLGVSHLTFGFPIFCRMTGSPLCGGGAVEASGAAASVALAGASGQPIPGYGRPGGVRPDHPTPSRRSSGNATSAGCCLK